LRPQPAADFRAITQGLGPLAGGKVALEPFQIDMETREGSFDARLHCGNRSLYMALEPKTIVLSWVESASILEWSEAEERKVLFSSAESEWCRDTAFLRDRYWQPLARSSRGNDIRPAFALAVGIAHRAYPEALRRVCAVF